MIRVRQLFGKPGPVPEVMPCAGLQAAGRTGQTNLTGQTAPEEPTAAELLENFAGAMERWAQAGFKTVSREGYASRAAICDGCEYWKPRARLGLGKCAAPGCGCTRLKRWLASERCPQGKW